MKIKQSIVVHAYKSSTGEVKASLSYIVSSKLAWNA